MILLDVTISSFNTLSVGKKFYKIQPICSTVFVVKFDIFYLLLSLKNYKFKTVPVLELNIKYLNSLWLLNNEILLTNCDILENNIN